MNERRVFIVGGAGFIGSHFTDRLVADTSTAAVTVFDNFSSGRKWHVEPHLDNSKFSMVSGDAADSQVLIEAMRAHDLVIHLASNPDIARAAKEPKIDFDSGTLLTQNVIEAMRLSGAQTLLYASGSGVYGDLGEIEVREDFGPLIPISTYGASKLAGEALISAYAHMFGMTGICFRLANVVGPRQTHGVGFDFVQRLLTNPDALDILGDGSQSKSYIHVEDVVDAMLLVAEVVESPFEIFNVATRDYITVREIADLAIECLDLEATPEYRFTGGDRGWKGDVPIVRLNIEKLESLGWAPKRTSRQALKESMVTIFEDSKEGRI